MTQAELGNALGWGGLAQRSRGREEIEDWQAGKFIVKL
jgi:hypothetical protein